jgi:multiple sugar transport system permease protein
MRTAQRKKNRRPSLVPLPVAYVLLVLWSAACLFPLYWVAVTLLKGEYEIVKGPFYLPFVDFRPDWGASHFILADSHDKLLWQLLNSLAVGAGATALTVLLAGLFVYGLTRFRVAAPLIFFLTLFIFSMAAGSAALHFLWVAGALAVAAAASVLVEQRLRRWSVSSNIILFLSLGTRLLPPVVLVLPIYLMALQTGTLDTRFVLIVLYAATNLPIATFLLMRVFGDAPTEQEEAARLDGGSHLHIFFRIIVPMCAVGIGATAILMFILSWNEYLFAAYLAAGNAMTLPPWVVGQMSMKEAQVGGDLVEWSRLSAAIVVMVLPVCIILAVLQRFINRTGLWRRG